MRAFWKVLRYPRKVWFEFNETRFLYFLKFIGFRTGYKGGRSITMKLFNGWLLHRIGVGKLHHKYNRGRDLQMEDL